MHGLVNRSIQCFLNDTYGADSWRRIAAAAGLQTEDFDSLASYDRALTEAVLVAATAHLAKPRDMLLEDLGTYLVTHPNLQGLRRLLRFGGEGVVDFLHSLDELRDRARLAVPDLSMPVLQLRSHGDQVFTLTVNHDQPGFGHVMVGVLRAMADDYGALALLQYQGRRDTVETVLVEVLSTSFASGQQFDLAVRAG